MRRPRMSFRRRALALAVGTALLAWGMGTSATGAQEHHGSHGGHGGHDTTSTTGPPGPSTTTTTRPPQPGERTTEVHYGPYTAQAAPPAAPGQEHGHWHSGNQFAFNVEKPCTNCYITGMRARLVGPDRTTEVGLGNTGAQLHHMVLFNQDPARQDATCYAGLPFPLGLLFGQRFFASGDERTPSISPPGYGYYVGNTNWNLIWDLASMGTTAQQVYYEVSFDWIPAAQAPGMKNVEPIWFDIAQCGASTFSVPAGPSQRSWTWTVNRPGAILGMGGHVHDGGINIVIRNDSTGRVICDSRAGYGERPLYIDSHGERHISSMSTCGGTSTYDPVDIVTNGQRITITGHYNMPQAVNDQMGIVMAWVGPPSAGGGGGVPGDGACVTATNSQHVQAGRATQWLVWVTARGSNNSLGTTWETTSLREGPTGTWTRVASC